MSAVVDERVVEMRFDNKQFESNVQTSMSTIEKLKKSLNLTGASKGLENIGTAAKKVDVSGIGSAVDTVRMKFSALEVMGVTALANITNTAVNAGKQIASALTIEPVKSGFQEYETQINAVQTILANTSSKGTTLEQVNSALDELNHYADMTIYNFTEMTRNIGTFTAAGVDLNTSVAAIKGIANLAAVSGSTSQQASTAMYQLSQALAAGTVKLQDWNSVVNAGMGGQVFQDALKETARVHGIAIDQMIADEGSFRETLQKGWLSSEILTETLSKFTGDLNESQLKTMGYSEEQIASIIKMGQTANDAATKVKTFTQLFDTLKEAAQSGWTQSWEIIIGDFEEAKELLTGVSDRFSEIINNSANSRNELLEGAMSSNWDKLITKINDAGVETERFQEKLKAAMEGHGIDVDKQIETYGSLEKAFTSGAVSSDILKEAVDGLNKSLFDLSSIEGLLRKGSIGEDVTKIQEALSALGYDLGSFGVDGILGSATESAIRAFQEANNLTVDGIVGPNTIAALEAASESTEKVVDSCDDLISSITELGGRELLIESLKNGFEGILSIISPVKEAFRDIFPPTTSEQLYNAIQNLHEFSSNLTISEETADKIKRTFKGVFAVADMGVQGISTLGKGFADLIGFVSPAGDGILGITAAFGDYLVKIDKTVKSSDIFNKGLKKLETMLEPAAWKIKEFSSDMADTVLTFAEWADENDILVKGLDGLVSGAEKVQELFQAFMELPVVQENMARFETAFMSAFGDFAEYIDGGIDRITEFIERVKSVDSLSIDNISDILKDFKDNVLDYFVDIDGILETVKGIKDKIGNSLTGIKDTLNEHMGGILTILVGVGLVVMAKKLLGIIKSFAGIFGSLGDVVENFAGVLKGVQGVLSAYSTKIRSDAIYKIAKSVAILAGSIALLTMLDTEKMLLAAGSLAAIMVVLLGMSALVGKLGDIKSFSSSMLGISAGIFILVMALKQMEKLDGNLIGRDLGILVLLAGGLTAFAAVLSKVAPKLSSGSLFLLSFSASLNILVNAFAKIDALEINHFRQTITLLLSAMGGLALVAAVTGKTKMGSAASILAIAISLKMIVGIIGDIASIDLRNITSNLGAFVVVFGMFGILMQMSKNAGENAAKAGVGIFTMSAALLVISTAMKRISKMPRGDIQNATKTIAELLLVFGVVTAMSRLAGANAAKAGAMLLMMSGALAILTGVIVVLSGLNPDGVKRGVAAIVALELAFAVLIAATKFAGKAEGCKSTLITLAATIGVLAITLGALSMIEPGNLATAAGSLSAVMGMFSLMVASTAIAQKATGTLVVMTAVVAGLAGILYLLANNIDANAALPVAGALSALLLSLSASCLILSGIGVGGIASIKGALAGAVALDAVIVVVGALITGLGALVTYIPQAEEFLNAGLPVLEKIGYGLGSFFGNIVGGFSTGITSGLPAIGENLSLFMEAISGVDPDAASSAESIAKAILCITASEILTGIKSFLGFGSDFSNFSTNLEQFGQAMSKFSNAVSGDNSIDSEAVQNAAKAGEMLAALQESIPNQGGVLAEIIGDNDWSALSTGLVAFGQAMVNFSNVVSEEGAIDPVAIENATNAGKMFTELQSSIPNQGGVLAEIIGDNDWTALSTGLVEFGEAMCGFSKAVSGENAIDSSAIENATKAGEMLSALQMDIPNKGGLLSAIVGENDWSALSEGLVEFGNAMSDFSNAISGKKFDTTAVENVIENAGSLIDLQEDLEGAGGLWNLSIIGDNMTQFGGTLNSFYNQIKEINTSKLSAIITEIGNITSAIKSMSGIDTSGIENFGSAMSALGNSGIDSFAEAFGNSSSKLSSIGSTMTDSLVKGLSSKQSSLTTTASTMISSVLNTINLKASSFTAAGSRLLSNLVSGMNSQRGNVISSVASSISSAAGNARGYYGSFYSAGSYLVSGFVSGIRGNIGSAASAAAAMASAASAAARANLRIKSPSRVFYGIGDYAGQGFVNALRDYSIIAYRAGAKMADSASSGLSNAIGKLSDIVSHDIDAQPTICPVVDLSNVQSGVSAINGMFGFTPSLQALSNVRAISSVMNSRNQNGGMDDVVSAINKLRKDLGNVGGTSYNIGGITYGDGSDVSEAIKTLIRAAKIERRV